MIKFVADSSCDRPVIEGLEVLYPPLTISTDERSFCDDEQLDVKEMLDYLADYKGRSYTACPSVDSWLQAFEGGDEIYVATITSGLSGSYNSAMAARELYMQSNPEAKVHVFDSLSTGPEIVLLLEKLRDLKAAGLSFAETVAQGVEYQKKTRLFFALQNLHNMAQNGRVSKVIAAAVGMLSIRIVGTASFEGTLEQLARSRGDNKAMKELIAQMETAGYKGGRMHVTDADNVKLRDTFVGLVKEKWPHANISTAHCSGLCSYYAERGALMVGVETA